MKAFNSTLNIYKPLKAQKSINKVSQKHDKELALRAKLKRELIREHGKVCMTCGGKFQDFRGVSLSHIIPVGRGGKTESGNILLECGFCHEKFEKRPQLRPAKTTGG